MESTGDLAVSLSSSVGGTMLHPAGSRALQSANMPCTHSHNRQTTAFCNRLPGSFHAAVGRFLTVWSFLGSAHGLLAHKPKRPDMYMCIHPDLRTCRNPMAIRYLHRCACHATYRRLRLSGAAATASSSMSLHKPRLSSSATLAARSRSTASSDGVSSGVATMGDGLTTH